jgi:hypothetical protein
MRGSLGEKIGEGTMADIHAWAPGQVLKLFKAGVPRRFGEHEARMTRAAFAAGAPAPEVFDEVTLEGRFGIVLTRLDGPTLWQLLLTRAMTSEQAGAILATLYISVHKTPPPPDALSLRNWFAYASRVPGSIPEHIATGVLTLIERLPPGDGPERPRALNAAVQAAYARLAGVSPAALTLAMEPYLPILRAFALAERATNHARREWLIQRVEASLSSED